MTTHIRGFTPAGGDIERTTPMRRLRSLLTLVVLILCVGTLVAGGLGLLIFAINLALRAAAR